MSMEAVHAITDFLRHLNARDLPDHELFTLKAHAFDLMAESQAENGDTAAAAEAKAIADDAMTMAAEKKLEAAGWILCAHADRDGEGAHWKQPGEPCPRVDAR